jgi:type IV secretion system protein VirB8
MFGSKNEDAAALERDKTVVKGDDSRHYNRARDFETIVADAMLKSEKRAWNVAKLMCVIACLAIVALASLAPFYKVVPMVFEVNKNTGETQVVDVLSPKTVSTTEIEDKHYIETYVQSRERYLWGILQLDYDTVRNMSDENVRTDYSGQFDGPESLDKTLGKETQRTIVNITTIIPPNEKGKAIVSFDRITTTPNIPPGRPEHFVVTLSYHYNPSLFSREDVAINNPKGFKVSAYRRDQSFMQRGSSNSETQQNSFTPRPSGPQPPIQPIVPNVPAPGGADGQQAGSSVQ